MKHKVFRCYISYLKKAAILTDRLKNCFIQTKYYGADGVPFQSVKKPWSSEFIYEEANSELQNKSFRFNSWLLTEGIKLIFHGSGELFSSS